MISAIVCILVILTGTEYEGFIEATVGTVTPTSAVAPVRA